MIDENNIESIKVILIGNSGVGKTSIINQYINHEFNSSLQTTMGGTYYDSFIKCDDENIIRLHIWDTAGQERFRSVINSFYQNAQVVILVYDLTVEDSYNEIKNYWYNSAKEGAKEDAINVLVGNKEDLIEDEHVKEEINEESARDYAKEIKALFFKTSAKSYNKIVDLFEQIVKKYKGSKVAKTLKKQEYEDYQKKLKKPSQLDPNAIKKGGKKNCC